MAISRGMQWHGDEVLKKIRKAASDGLYEAANDLLKDSGEQVPFEVGTPGLFSSGEVDCPEGSLKATVSYDTPYAVPQHENRIFRHPNGRKAKYLEDPANANGARYMEHVAKRIREAHG